MGARAGVGVIAGAATGAVLVTAVGVIGVATVSQQLGSMKPLTIVSGTR